MATVKTQTTESTVKSCTLPNGMKVEFDPTKANGHCLMKCREASGGIATVVYIMAEIATFDGKQLPAPEILNFSAYDIIELEAVWAECNPKKGQKQ